MTTILLVDDDAAIRDVFSIFLDRSGFAVKTAGGGDECIEVLQKAKPDLVILDIMMTPTDGWETLTAIRSNSGTSDVPVTMFSGKSPIVEEISRYGGWIEDYLLKPMKFTQISDTLSTILDRSAAMRLDIERMTALGADSRVIDECCYLTRSLFIRKKFSKVCYKDAEQCEGEISLIEDRLRQLHQSIKYQEKIPSAGLKEI